ncbi:hypothetical protein ACFLSJ_00765 [Verrucomicrobiota bacterium]
MTESTFYTAFDQQAQEAGCLAADGPDTRPPEATPTVVLPAGAQTITASAADLGRLLAPTRTVYNRGGTVVRVFTDKSGSPVVEPVKPAAMSSIFETVAQLVKLDRRGNGEHPQAVPTVCTEQMAKVIMAAPGFLSRLPQLSLITKCPVLVKGSDGTLRQVCGYDEETGILAHGYAVPQISVDRAKAVLDDSLADFQFATRGDQARAVAALITPALITGDLIDGRAPIDLGEADDSQAGKGYRNRLTAAVYNDSVRTVTQRKGGVGSLEEAFNRYLIQGANFVSLDNIRGQVDSPAIESFLTEDTYMARAPYVDAMVETRRTVVQLTSNRADITGDLANRSSCVRILKRTEGYAYRTFAEGDILGHVRANQPLYLGAVFSVIKAWWTAGRPKTEETRHDFRAWVQSLDWICQNLLGTCPIMDGHRETQVRITTPALNWLRDIALAVKRQGHFGHWLRTHELIELAGDDPSVELPGQKDGVDMEDDAVRRSILQACGRRLKQCFRRGEAVVIDGMRVVRRVVQVERTGSYGGPVDTPEYMFGMVSAPDPHLIRTEPAVDEVATCTDAPEGSTNKDVGEHKENSERTMETIRCISADSERLAAAFSSGLLDDQTRIAGFAPPASDGGVLIGKGSEGSKATAKEGE